MKKLSSLVFALSSAVLALAHGACAHAAGADRGDVLVSGPAVKAVTEGPAVLHGYSGFSGGAIFIAPVVAGTDADCSGALGTRANIHSMPLVADRMAYVLVGSGHVACLVTDTQRPFELLWHAFPVTSSEAQLATAKR